MSSRVAVVTGGGTGVGRAAVLALAQRGYSLVLAGRRESFLVDVSQQAKALGGRSLPVVVDVADESSVQHLFQKTLSIFGRIDLLFNNAGQLPPLVPLEDVPLNEWRRVIDVNLTGTFLCLREAFRVMKAQSPMGGRIINNGSLSAQVPRPHAIPYIASKHAITGLTKAASLEGRKYNIACGQIDIGNTGSDMASVVAHGMLQANGTVIAEPLMDAVHIGEAVAYMDSLPLDANVQLLTVLPTAMPFVGRG